MKGLCGYGRYDDAPGIIGCPRTESDMTPCVARDGHLAATPTESGSEICVGCEQVVSDLFRDVVAVISKIPPQEEP